MADNDEQPDEQLDEEAAAAAAAVALIAALITDDVERAVTEPDDERRVALFAALAVSAFTLAYENAGGTGSSAEEARAYVYSLRPAFGLLQPDGTPAQQERMTDIIAHSATSAATLAVAMDTAAPDDDVKFEWRTMRDDRVRDLHRPVDGQMRAAGDPFDVGGHPQRYPGHPVGPPEAWINCRCFLHVHASSIAASDTPNRDHDLNQPLTARAFDTEQRKKLASKGHAMPDGSYPIANEEDLRNAIQAIGRAKDPDAVKAHIRKRARALGLTDLIPDSWTASSDINAAADSLLAWPKSTSPPGTHDAPGWITNPRETQRLRNYWTKGAGAGKIRWGTPNDLTRCAKLLGKYVGPQYAWGTCQNLHHTVFGKYNPESRGRKGGGDPDDIIEAIDAAFTAAAQLEETMTEPTKLAPPLEWFTDPGFDAPTPLTITSDGRVLGHLATWDTCHVGITGECVTPPRSNTGYAHFRTGEVETAEGDTVATGAITMDTGHAARDDEPGPAAAHYDNTGTGVADVAAGEDDHGIWVAGAMRPGVSEQQMYVLKATGALSGDWRRIGGNLELVAALAVNVPGFPIPRPELAASGERLYSLVAAGIVTVDPNATEIDRIALAVVNRLDERERRAANAARAAALRAQINTERVAELVAAIGVPT